IARRLGHAMNPTYPALTPLTAAPHPHAALAGVSLEVTLRAPGARPAFETRNGFLFTHRGWSGPSVLDASHFAIRGRGDGGRQDLEVQCDDADAAEWTARLAPSAGTVLNAVAARLPRRLAEHLFEELEIAPDVALAQLRREDRMAL